jgi:Tol biopolymer transport system component
MALMEAEEIRAQLERVLSSAIFADAGRAQKFLRFVVEVALAGRHDEIKESVIGVEVLGRTASFDPRNDPIVRVEAGRLRSRLLSYYQSEGAADTVLIDLPKGGYVPQFQKRPALPAPTSIPPPGEAAVRPVKTPIASTWGLLAVACALCVLLLLGATWVYLNRTPAREPMRLSVLPPEGAVLSASAISPDGRYLAFSATTGKTSRVWIRALDSVEAKVLPGTEEAAYPFWSPDSKWIAFFSAGKLKKIPVSGGPAQAVCNTQAGFGGTWGSQNVIAFAQRPAGTIFQVPADGGTPRPVTTLDAARGELAHEFPSFLPDGRHFLYSVTSRGPGESTLRAGSLDGRESKFLLNADLGAAYAPAWAGHPGALLFAYRGALRSQAFDAEHLELRGSAVQLAGEVRYVAARADLSAAANGVFAYWGNSEVDRQLTWFDRNGKALAAVGPPNSYFSVRLSPDEKRLAIEAVDAAAGRSEIWIMDLNRGSLSRIGAQAVEAFAPIWSPDGSEVAFSAETSSGMNLMRQRLDQLSAAPLLEMPGVKIPTDWSADGKFVAYSSPWPEYLTLNAWVMPVRNSGNDKPRRYTNGGHNDGDAAFSPGLSADSSRWIAYTSDETGQDEVYVKTFPAGDRQWQVSPAGGWMPQWRHDGRELFYLTPDSKLMAVDISAGPNFASGTPHALFETTIVRTSYPVLPGIEYAVSRDGQRFLVNSALRKNLFQTITVVFT